MKRLYPIILSVCFIFHFNFITHADDSTKNELYTKTELRQKKLDLKSIQLTNCDTASEINSDVFLLSCMNTTKDTEEDYGQRLHLVKINNDKPTILFEETGAMDAYSYHLFFYSNSDKSNELVIFAETGTEYSWGVDVYLLKNLKMHWIGNIGAMLVNRPNSAISNVIVKKDQNQLIFSFHSDVDIPIDESIESYLKVPKNEIKYIFANNKFERVLSSRISQILLSKK